MAYATETELAGGGLVPPSSVLVTVLGGLIGMGLLLLFQHFRPTKAWMISLVAMPLLGLLSKLLRTEGGDRSASIEAFKKEIAVWEQVTGHPNVLSIIEADEYQGEIYIVSEYASDGTLTDWLARHNGKAPSFVAAVDMTMAILNGLDHLHTRPRPIIHQDLKPDNILLQGETPRLADFGFARILEASGHSFTKAGTPYYMAPEALDGVRSVQTDLWAVGVIFHKLVLGRLPFDQIAAIMNSDPRHHLLSAPQPLRRIAARSLEKKPVKRYRSAREMADELRMARHYLSRMDDSTPNTFWSFSWLRSARRAKTLDQDSINASTLAAHATPLVQPGDDAALASTLLSTERILLTEDDLRRFVGKKYAHYSAKWTKYDVTGLSFNWAALLGSGFWMAYRKIVPLCHSNHDSHFCAVPIR